MRASEVTFAERRRPLDRTVEELREVARFGAGEPATFPTTADRVYRLGFE